MANLRFALRLFLLLSWLCLILSPIPASASPDAARWSAVNIPAEGKPGNWVLAAGSNVQHLTISSDGALYCYANPTGTSYTLFKSTDNGYGWSYTGQVTDSIVDIATAVEDADTIIYATTSKVYESTNAGSSFMQLPPNPGGAGIGNVEITAIAVTRQGNNTIIAVGTRDTDGAQYGGVYIFDESKSFTWINTNIGNYDVYALEFSPSFAIDGQLVAVVTDETDTFVISRIGDGGWGSLIGNARLNKDNSAVPVPVSVDTSAAIAFPTGYNASSQNPVLFIGIDAGVENGDVYKIIQIQGISTATDLNIGSIYGLNNVDVTSLAITGSGASANLLAGAAGSAMVYSSFDGGANWTRNAKPPTGQSRTFVLMSQQSPTGAYAATSGTESAVSYTVDSGANWNQISLIDATIASILDLAIAPQENAIFLLTFGGKHSLWRSLNGGTRWERLFSSTLPDVDSFNRVKLPPAYGASKVVFLAGISNTNPAIWKSTDNGQNFMARITHDPVSGAAFSIDAWAVLDDNTLFIGSYDGSNGLLYRTINSGLFYAPKTIVGTRSLRSIALSPGYSQDRTILVGNTFGGVFLSRDNSGSFEPLPPNATSPPLSGNITVAFDPDFSENRTVYAASDTANKGVYRFITGKSTSWESIDSTLPTGALINQLAVSSDGILYAVNSKAGGGMERCLNPTFSLGPTFERVAQGLDSNATLSGLWQFQDQLWSIDSTNNRLVTYADSLASPVTLSSPADQAAGVDIKNVTLDWKTLDGATKYKWQLNYGTDFSSIPAGFEADTAASSVRLPALELDTTYYWRVKATEPISSPWSDKWSFTTSLGSGAAAAKLSWPEAGADNIPLKPVFQWETVAGAESYELLVSADISFTNPIVARIGDYALPANAWQCNVALSGDTTYYWKVRARNAETSGAWSAVGAFTTRLPLPAPPSTTTPTPTPTPTPIPLPTPSAATATLTPKPAPSPIAKTVAPDSSLAPSEPPPTPYIVNELIPPELAKWLIPMGIVFLGVMMAILVTLIILAVRIGRD